MKKYRCKICGDIYDEKKEGVKFEDLPDSWVCPKCGVPKSLFELIEEVEDADEELFTKAVEISDKNVAIERINDKCINCGICEATCIKREGMKFDSNSELCVNCGQCIQACPTRALIPKNEIDKLMNAKKEGKITIAYISPSTRVAFGDIFDLEKGEFTQKN